jgi:glycine/D-amino acid oxidase-like deaminating enzyme
VLAAAQSRGVQVHPDSGVTSVQVDGNRCTGVVANGSSVTAKCVVVAAGCFSGGIDWLTRYAPTRPVRGQLLALRPKTEILRRTLRSSNGYLVPRPDGRIIAGSTLEDAGFEKHLTPSGIQTILAGVLELAPALATAQIVDAWAGLRPGTPDNLPILGPTDIRGLYFATGHYRNGILLAPATARLMSDWILGRDRTATVNTKAFSPLRFSEGRIRSQKTASAKS